MKKFSILLVALVAASLVLAACGPSDQQKASEDCLVFQNEVACKYVDGLQNRQEISDEIQKLEDEIAELEAKIEAKKEELKADEESLQLLKEAWQASKTTEEDN